MCRSCKASDWTKLMKALKRQINSVRQRTAAQQRQRLGTRYPTVFAKAGAEKTKYGRRVVLLAVWLIWECTSLLVEFTAANWKCRNAVKHKIKLTELAAPSHIVWWNYAIHVFMYLWGFVSTLVKMCMCSKLLSNK